MTKRKAPLKLVDTEMAALCFLMWSNPSSIQLFREAEIDSTKRRIYNLARSGKLTRHGTSGRGQARWDLSELRGLFSGPL